MLVPKDKLLAPDWVQLVFHVLAHVPSSVPSSLENSRYVKWVEQQLGNACERELGQGIQAVEALGYSHTTLARLQTLAWLHPNVEAAVGGAQYLLGELNPETVLFDLEIQQGLLMVAADAEVLRCAVLLEAAHAARLDASFVDWGGAPECQRLALELSRVSASAPRLASLGVQLVPALGLRGRVYAGVIYVGLPNHEVGPSAEHAAWQAAHEATVYEVAEAYTQAIAPDGGEQTGHQGVQSTWESVDRSIEQMALLVLKRRAERNQVAENHLRWLACFGDTEALLQAPLAAEKAALVARLSST